MARRKSAVLGQWPYACKLDKPFRRKSVCNVATTADFAPELEIDESPVRRERSVTATV
jgi:hypothetical protein